MTSDPTVLENFSYGAVIATAVIAGVALAFAGYEIRSAQSGRRQGRALAAVQRWGDASFAEQAKDATLILRSGGWRHHVDNRTRAMVLVNFFEALAADEVANRADQRVAHENFGFLALYPHSGDVRNPTAGWVRAPA